MRETDYFGPRGDAPIFRSLEQVAAPIGAECIECGEPIEEGETGFMQGLVRRGESGPVVERVPVHDSCLLLSTSGHQYGVCLCPEREAEFAGWSKREMALELTRRMSAR